MTRLPDYSAVERRLEAATGLDFDVSGRVNAGGSTVIVRPMGFEHLHGFTVQLDVAWRSLSARLVPDTFAGDILAVMAAAPTVMKRQFCDLAGEFSQRAQISLKLDSQSVDPANMDAWPERWRAIELSAAVGPFAADTVGLLEARIADAALIIGSLTLSLLPLQPEVSAESGCGEEEGAVSYGLSKRYERNPANRAACIALKGTACYACGAVMADVYGSLAEGFVHVHHATPLSLMEPGHVVNVAEELFPLCPNCHSVLHRKSPPLPVEALRRLFGEKTAE